MQSLNVWFASEVKIGDKLGRNIGFPTANLDVDSIPGETDQGVYACEVKIEDQVYRGALYFGPRLVLGEIQNVLEINILNFNKEVYGQKISFRILRFIRKPINFSDFNSLKLQLQNDIESVDNYFSQ